jgi:serine/threonine protein kinase
MATVYLARSQGARGFARDVALKLTHAHLTDTIEFAAVLLEEAKIASRIKHRNVVTILDVGEDPLGLFLVMDYVEGDTLAGLLRSGIARGEPMPSRIAVRMLLDALAGLHAAHELCDDTGLPMKVVHRDFSPQNILVGLDGVSQLADFGIAKAADRTGETATGVIKGKVAYMAPEHAQAHAIDRRADVWSAGVVAWEILAGRALYPNKGLSTLLKIISERPPLVRTVVPSVGEEVEQVVARALDPDLATRCPTAALFARDLANAFGFMGRLAEHDEVAEYVRGAAGAKLATRRTQVQDALGLRARMDALAEASVNGSSSRTPSQGGAPDAQSPREGLAETSSAAISVELDVTDVESATETSPRPLSTSSLTREAGAPGELTETTSVVEAVKPWPFPVRLLRAPQMWLAAVLTLVVGAFVLGVTLRHSPPDTAVGVTVTGRASSSAAPIALPATPASATPAPVVARKVDLHASARVSWVRVNARSILVEPPSSNVSFDRSAEDGPGPLALVVTALDGRKRVATLTPEATVLDIDFPPVAAPPMRPPPALPKKSPPNPYGP